MRRNALDTFQIQHQSYTLTTKYLWRSHLVGSGTSRTWKDYYVNPAPESDKFLDMERVEAPVIIHNKKEVRMSGKGDIMRRLIPFAAKYKPTLATFDQKIEADINSNDRNKDPCNTSKWAILNITWLYRIASNIPFLISFWSDPGNHIHKILSGDLQSWLNVNTKLSDEDP